jgi:hypothetical protein
MVETDLKSRLQESGDEDEDEDEEDEEDSEDDDGDVDEMNGEVIGGNFNEEVKIGTRLHKRRNRSRGSVRPIENSDRPTRAVMYYSVIYFFKKLFSS